MIHLDFIDRAETTASTPTVCMHCEDPTCAEVCPADAIKKGEDGVVRSALKPRCIACSNCVLACPFGVPKVQVREELMMKCDMCYDRTSVGLRPMCATVCPSQALMYVTPEEAAKLRRDTPVNTFRFGNQEVKTKVFVYLPKGSDTLDVDVMNEMWSPEE
jgi:Fe-S-cluster-containing dehydrogenase component